MKKCLFMVAVLLMTSISFASTANETIKKSIEKDKISLVQCYSMQYDYEMEIFNYGHYVSCHANIYYNGRLVKTLNASASGETYAEANQECARQAYALAQKYISDQEARLE
jgi:hypothetical protein